jgi:HK97 family phage major capsid protein
MGHTDALLSRYAGEIEERQKFIDGLVESAEKETRDLDPKELELITRARDRISTVNGLVEPLRETLRISRESAEKTAALAREFQQNGRHEVPPLVEYRSAGGYILDRWRAGIGAEDARDKLELFHRAAAHQTTGDNPGLLPEQILGPVINFIDAARPLVNFFGPRQLPSGSWSRPRVTQHTQIGAQTAEKAELVSRKMTIGKLPVLATTYGGYVNVSRQDVDWTQPNVMDIVINDLAAQYALETENAFADALAAAATAETALPTGAATAAQITGALWTAVGNVYAATKGQGRLFQAVSPDMLGTIFGPMYAPVNPTNSQSPGFTAADYGQGTVGGISGIPMIVSAGLNAGTWIVGSTAAAEAYEDRIGSLQVVEPSVLGVQVAYAGYFASLMVEPTGLRKIAKTP